MRDRERGIERERKGGRDRKREGRERARPAVAAQRHPIPAQPACGRLPPPAPCPIRVILHWSRVESTRTETDSRACPHGTRPRHTTSFSPTDACPARAGCGCVGSESKPTRPHPLVCLKPWSDCCAVRMRLSSPPLASVRSIRFIYNGGKEKRRGAGKWGGGEGGRLDGGRRGEEKRECAGEATWSIIGRE